MFPCQVCCKLTQPCDLLPDGYTLGFGEHGKYPELNNLRIVSPGGRMYGRYEVMFWKSKMKSTSELFQEAMNFYKEVGLGDVEGLSESIKVRLQERPMLEGYEEDQHQHQHQRSQKTEQPVSFYSAPREDQKLPARELELGAIVYCEWPANKVCLTQTWCSRSRMLCFQFDLHNLPFLLS